MDSVRYIHVDGIVEVPREMSNADAVGAVTDAMIDMVDARGWSFCGGTHEDDLVDDDLVCPCKGGE